MMSSLDRATATGAAGVTGRPFKRLLVPLDGSALAERALPFARTLARTFGADLIFVRAANAHGLALDREEARLKALAEAEAYLEGLKTANRADYGLELSAPIGEPVTEIGNVARLRQADLIVMTTHGRGGLSRLLLGSVAEGLVRQTGLPLLLIRAGLPLASWEHSPRRLLVPLDGSVASAAVLPAVAALAQAVRARVTLLRAIPPLPAELAPYEIVRLPEDTAASLADRARIELSRVASELNAQGLSVEAEVVVGSPVEAIVSAAARQQADLIVMNTRTRGDLERTIAGSVADEVLRGADVPVLMFHVR
jgi:nucleotide-binding universal stress UspA family protein